MRLFDRWRDYRLSDSALPVNRCEWKVNILVDLNTVAAADGVRLKIPLSQRERAGVREKFRRMATSETGSTIRPRVLLAVGFLARMRLRS